MNDDYEEVNEEELDEEYDFENDDDEWCVDYCSDCTEYGDDYYIDENGEYVCRCLECPFNPFNDDDDE